jgi:hypothetical protein
MKVGSRECEAMGCQYMAKEIQLDDWEEFQKRKKEAEATGTDAISEEWEEYKNVKKDPKTGRLLANLKIEDAQKIIKIKSKIITEGKGPKMSEVTSSTNKLHQRINCDWTQWLPILHPSPGGSEENYISQMKQCSFMVPQTKTCKFLSGHEQSNGQDWPLGLELALLEMRLGETRIVPCPPELAYGDEAQGQHIPPYSFVTFKIYLRSHQPMKFQWG